MSENYNDDEIIDSSEDTEKKRNKSEKFCFLCRRPESKAGPMIELPNNIHVCTDCMQKSFNSMNQQFNEGKFNYSDLLNMPNVSMIDLGSFQNPVQQPKKEKKKKKQEKPVLDALLAWANEASGKAAPKSALGRALHYLLEQWPYLARYLEDGRLELSNNRAERSIKPFGMGRKNWLFANTPGGAQASAVIYSLIETAKENSLDPYRYLLWILQTAPQLSETNKAWAESLLPANAPEECYMSHK